MCLSSVHAHTFGRLEQDVKKLKADLQASRQVEQDLRSQIGTLGSAERSIRTELGQLRQENELLQNKWVGLLLMGSKQCDTSDPFGFGSSLIEALGVFIIIRQYKLIL